MEIVAAIINIVVIEVLIERLIVMGIMRAGYVWLVVVIVQTFVGVVVSTVVAVVVNIVIIKLFVKFFVVVIAVHGCIHGQRVARVLLLGRGMVENCVRWHQRLRVVDRRNTSIYVSVKELKMELFKVKETAEHGVGDLHFESLQDDVGECHNY